MPKTCANNTVIVHSQWPRVEDAKVLYVALTVIALAKTHGVL